MKLQEGTKFKRLASIEAEVLVSTLEQWALNTRLGENLVAAGTFSGAKRWLALWQAVAGPLTLEEIGRESLVGISPGLIAKWRTESTFRTLADEAAREFAKHWGSEVAASAFGDKIRRLVLTSLWVRLPGFDIKKNPVVEEINKAAGELNKNLAKRNIMRLYSLLVAFRDMLRFAQEHLKPAKWQEIEKQAHAVITPKLAIFETRVKEAKEKGLLDEELSEGLLNTTTSIEFLCAYSKIVI